MKKALSSVFWGGVVVGLLMSTSALAYTIDDYSVSYERDSRNHTYFDIPDVIGDPLAYNTFGINVSTANGKVSIGLHTNVGYEQSYTIADGTTYSYYLADLAIGALDGSFSYGLVLYDHESWDSATTGTLMTNDLKVGLYLVSDWYTSNELNLESGYATGPASTDSGIFFGSLYSYEGAWVEPLVAVEIGTLLADITVVQTDLGGDGETSPLYLYTIEFDESLLAALGLEDGFEVFWAGESSASDAIRGAIPEPSTFALLGLGVLGLWRVAGGRRK